MVRNSQKAKTNLRAVGLFRGNLAVAARGIKPLVRSHGVAPHPH
jgi:hypothetical protein